MWLPSGDQTGVSFDLKVERVAVTPQIVESKSRIMIMRRNDRLPLPRVRSRAIQEAPVSRPRQRNFRTDRTMYAGILSALQIKASPISAVTPRDLASRQDKIRLVREDFVESRIQAGNRALPQFEVIL